MRYRLIFIAGLGIGFVFGARAGRERYEQLRRIARRAADNPTVQQAADTVQAQAADLARTARGKIADRAETARARMEAALHERVPSMRTRDSNGRSHGSSHEPFDATSGMPIDPEDS
jgi:DNA-binding transcriptional MocR family regulator